MARLANCPKCDQKLTLPDEGGVFACPRCQHQLRLKPTSTKQVALPEVEPLAAENKKNLPVRTRKPRTQRRRKAAEAQEKARLLAAQERKTRLMMLAGVGGVLVVGSIVFGVIIAMRSKPDQAEVVAIKESAVLLH